MNTVISVSVNIFMLGLIVVAWTAFGIEATYTLGFSLMVMSVAIFAVSAVVAFLWERIKRRDLA